jgi:type VI secretion system secreted protein VgrG
MADRLLELRQTSLFGNEATITELTGREELSRLFEFQVTIASPKDKLKPEDVIGQTMAVRIDSTKKPPRWVHGYISHFWAGDFSMTKGGKPSRSYRVRLVPWLWFATRASRSFVYLPDKEKKSIKEVLEVVFDHVKAYGHVQSWHSLDKASILSSRKVEHCVQYRETDYNFLTRTLEKYGVYFYFEHTENSHKLILSDQGQYPSAIDAEVELPKSNPGELRQDSIIEWEHAYEMVSGKWEHNDYNFTTPSTSLTGKGSKKTPLKNNSGYELYDFPGDYATKDEGEEIAKRRLQEEEMRFDSVSGRSTCRSFAPGFGFKLTKHANCKDEENKQYLLTSVRHHATQPGGPHTDQGSEAMYMNEFECIPRTVQYRPNRETPEPFLASVQTAKVVGPPGEEIHVDNYGRVKVRFQWDREPENGEHHSCWMRVSQLHAGPGFGGISIPRVGEEVIVSFIEGDPDRPIITGRVYHQESMPPFGLPGEKTRSGIKTKTYKGEGYNELTMDDTPGKEQIRIHGQYDMNSTILHDQTLDVGNNQTQTVGVDRSRTVGNNETVSVGSNRTMTVGANHSETIGANQIVNVAANQSNTVGANKTETVAMMSNETVGATKTVNVGAVLAQTVGGAMNIAVGAASSEQVGLTKTIVVGKDSSQQIGEKYELVAGTDGEESFGGNLKITVGGDFDQSAGGKLVGKAPEITLQAAMKIVLNCGASSITLTPAMIEIKAPLVKINC